ncbi:MAG: hypothetical protein H6581_16805 [Bacteroidia bacterium]|nr:hypothetical protein [Bacteroidia bacterium]
MENILIFKYEVKKGAVITPLIVLIVGILLFLVSVSIPGLGKFQAIGMVFGIIIGGFGLFVLKPYLTPKRFSLILSSESLKQINHISQKTEEIFFSEIGDYKVAVEAGISLIEITYGKQNHKLILIESLFEDASTFDLFLLHFENRLPGKKGE